jgi:hypothetical protein
VITITRLRVCAPYGAPARAAQRRLRGVRWVSSLRSHFSLLAGRCPPARLLQHQNRAGPGIDASQSDVSVDPLGEVAHRVGLRRGMDRNLAHRRHKRIRMISHGRRLPWSARSRVSRSDMLTDARTIAAFLPIAQSFDHGNSADPIRTFLALGPQSAADHRTAVGVSSDSHSVMW